jgi:hypothetical protein
LKLNFVVNENYLIAHTLGSTDASRYSSSKHVKDIKSFQKDAWEESKSNYNFLIGQALPDDLSDEGLGSISISLSGYFSTLRANKHYQRILSHTEKYLAYCEDQWNYNYPATNRIISEITGFRLKKNFTIFITHPSLKNGKYLGNNQIAWGHNEDWSNYTTVYLWHEIMHSYFDTKQLDHVIISFVTDEELRIKLNGGKYPPFMTHKYLHPMMKKSLHLWEKYLKSESKDILNFKAQLLEKRL